MLASHQISHAPTIGEMYEGLTQKGLKQSLPTFLKVVSGFARDAAGDLSGQLDCMVVVGEGEQVPNTHRWIYPIEQVVAVVEVKKNFTRTDLIEGGEALGKLAWAMPAKTGVRRITVERAFETISGYAFPDNKNSIPSDLRTIYHFLVGEAVSPVRILLGFHGYKTENGLRKALAEVMATTVITAVEAGSRRTRTKPLRPVAARLRVPLASLHGGPRVYGRRWPACASLPSTSTTRWG
ncbi:DUF6602 domain-containing protein [Myxococcus hansupus]|uniref:DUF6602 domain-containing protein n=1 Tax=Pseudomyxococcus hansupus TaxID=1297742 RepID=UPI003B82FA46